MAKSRWLLLIPPFIAGIIYIPGLGGTFHFDDFPNLSVLGSYGAVESWSTFVAYLKSAVASKIGRPLAMSTFLLNAQSWPAEARPFLATNIAIHSANALLAALAFYLVLKKAGSTNLSTKALPIAVVGAVLWAAHPFLTSTVLYVVQRMTLLSAFFGLCAFLVYLRARIQFNDKNGLSLSQAIFYTLAIGVLTLLGVLCKENAALIPLLILVIEFFGIRLLWSAEDVQRKKLNTWLLVFLGGPTLYVVYKLSASIFATGLFEPIAGRPFTGIERLLAQPQILFYYLYCLIFPQPSYPGLFYDGHPLALADPKQILAWIPLAVLSAITATGVFLRRFWPLPTLACVFFLGGHLIESLVPGLEPIFEHRNYLPSLFIFLAASAGLFSIPLDLVRRFSILGVAILLIAFSYSHASLWGDPLDLKVMWSNSNSWSERSQVSTAKALMEDGRNGLALRLLQTSMTDIPASPSLLFLLFVLERKLGINDNETGSRALNALESAPFNRQYPRLANLLVEEYLKTGDDVVPLEFIDSVFDVFLNREQYQQRIPQTIIRENRLTISLKENRIESACGDAAWLLKRLPRVGTPVNFAARFAQYGYLEDALGLLDNAESRLSLGLYRQVMPQEWYEQEIDRLKALIKEDIMTTNTASSSFCEFSGVDRSELADAIAEIP